jgi:competence protein ComEA
MGVVAAVLAGMAVAAVSAVPALAADKAPAAAGAVMGKVNVNTATAEQLAALPGVGEVTAKAIVQYREMNGPFKKVDDLMEVKGIGEKKLEAIRSLVTLE